ncbi:hypothetical protein BD413DRAFT_71739 [Trametes elegans]|nr:hypothetical protein BD413DRAFT_71739 [Trametes elegans]
MSTNNVLRSYTPGRAYPQGLVSLQSYLTGTQGYLRHLLMLDTSSLPTQEWKPELLALRKAAQSHPVRLTSDDARETNSTTNPSTTAKKGRAKKNKPLSNAAAPAAVASSQLHTPAPANTPPARTLKLEINAILQGEFAGASNYAICLVSTSFPPPSRQSSLPVSSCVYILLEFTVSGADVEMLGPQQVARGRDHAVSGVF